MNRFLVRASYGLVASVLTSAATTFCVAAPPPGEDMAGKRMSVEASIDHASGDPYIMARRRTGDFTIPDGYRAVNFRYAWGDPTSGRESSRLSPKNLEAVKGWVPQDIGAPGTSLGPGRYRFSVGGTPGAMGTLSFTLVRFDDPRVGGAKQRIVEVETWAHEYPEWKSKATYVFDDNGVVTGTMDETIDYPKFVKNESMQIDAARQSGKFSGTAAGNVITGTWTMVTHPHTIRWEGSGNNPAFSAVDQSRHSMQVRVVLYADGTLSETGRGTGTAERQWSANAPGGSAGKHEAWPLEFAFPNEYIKQPITGTWKDRAGNKPPPANE